MVQRVWLYRSSLPLLFLIAYAVRIYGAWSSIVYIPDTQIVREALGIGQMLAGQATFELSLAGPKYPLTLPLYLLAGYGGLFVGGRLTGVFPSVGAFVDFLFAQREIVHFFSVALLGLITASAAPLIYKLARSVSNQHTGWVAAGLVTFDLLLVHLSHQARPHAPLASLSLLAVMLLVKMYKTQSWRWMIVATIASALVVGTLQSGVVIVIPFGLAWALSLWQAKREGYLRVELSRLAVSSVLLIAATAVVYPAIFSEYSQALLNVLSGNLSISLGGGGHGFSLQSFSLSHAPIFLNNWFGYQPLIVLLLPIALPYFLWSLRASWPALLVGGSLPLVNLIMWGLYYDQSARFWATLALFSIVPVAYLIEDIGLRIKAAGRNGLSRVVQLAVIAPSLVLTVRLDYVLSQTDTRTIASNWIETNLPSGTALISNFQMMELMPTRDSLKLKANDFPDALGTFDQWLLNLPAEVYPEPAFDIVDGNYYWPDETTAQKSLVSERRLNYSVIQLMVDDLNEQSNSINSYMQVYGAPQLVVCPGHNFNYAYLPIESVDWAWQSIWQFNRPGPIVVIYKLSDVPVAAPLQFACRS